MSSSIVPSGLQAGVPQPSMAGGLTAPSGGQPDDAATNLAEQIGRSFSALRRYKWLMLAIVAIGTSVGYALTRIAKPTYTVAATIWVNRSNGAAGPISSPGLITDALSWPDLATSFIVLDNVVAKLALHVEPHNVADSAIVRHLLPSPSLQPGTYDLTLGGDGNGYTLIRRAVARGETDTVIERGVVGDSIGRKVGFLWQPSRELLAGRTSVAFDVITPREASANLALSLRVTLPPGSNLMRLRLSGSQSPALLASIMNTEVNEFVSQAGKLKTENLTVMATTVDEQLKRAYDSLRAAEVALESFKVNTITLPSENTVVTPGVAMATNPVMTQFFTDNVQYHQLTRDRQAMEKIVADADAHGGRLSMDALLSLPLLIQKGSPLQTEVSNLETQQAQLRNLQRTFTDSMPDVQRMKSRINAMETQTIPVLARQALQQLADQEGEMKRRIDGQASELRAIPTRTVEEARRQREVDVRANIYTDLQRRSVAAALAKLGALPDISVLDPAVAPSRPSADTKARLFLVAIAASLGVAVALALLLDRLDKRFRYPHQATSELGLDIVGAIPTLTNPRNSAARLQEATQLVESFRSLSLSLRSAFDGTGSMQLTVSSPGPGDGKSFISANLSSALADGGFRTLLIDGDIRRGALHSVFAPMVQVPGLLDFLAGEATLSEVIRSTSHSNLFVVPCGKRRRHGPELLAGQGMTGLIRDLGNQFDAIIVDSAPLGAGIDPFALGVATGAMLIVLRTGETDRRLAHSRLEVLDRLPVRVLGTVLNDIGENPQFKYYYYLEGYGSLESGADPTEQIGAGNGSSGHQ